MGSSAGEDIDVGRGPYAYRSMGTVGPGEALACQNAEPGAQAG